MKSRVWTETVLMACILLAATSATLAQSNWTRLPAPTTRDLFDVTISGDQIVVVGDSGTTAVSSDRGQTWYTMEFPQQPGTRARLYRVVRSAAGVYYVAGELTRGESFDSVEPFLLRSTTGALPWARITPTELGVGGGLLYDLEISPQHVITVVGRDSALQSMALRSVTDEATWTRAYSGTPYSQIIALEYGDNGVGLMIEQWQPGSQVFYRLFRSGDGGATWTESTLEFPFRNASKVEVAHAGDQTWIVTTSQGPVYRSIDDGHTWTQVHELIAWRLDFDGPIGYAAPGRQHPGYPMEITLSTDAGLTWQRQSLPGPTARVFSVTVSGNTAVAVGSEGAVWITENLGGVAGVEAPDLVSVSSDLAVVHRTDAEIVIRTSISGASQARQIMIYDLLGRLRKRIDLAPHVTEHAIATDALEPGAYICRLGAKGVMFVVKSL